MPEVQRILGINSFPSFGNTREGRAELLSFDCYDSNASNQICSPIDLDPLDTPLFGARIGRDDELQLALTCSASSASPSSSFSTSSGRSTANLGISIEMPLLPPVSWDVDPDVMSTLTDLPVNDNVDDDKALSLSQHFSFRKTGTTIVGCLADSGRTVVIAADTRATDGTTVADARCEKVHRIADNVWCCGAGTSGDIDALVREARYSFLQRGAVSESIGNGNEGGRIASHDDTVPGQMRPWLPKARVSAVVRFLRDTLYESGGGIGVNLVLGGYDVNQGQAVLVAIHPHGSVDSVPFTALGSGGLAAMSVLESRYRPDVTVEEAVRIVKEAVSAGISNDLGSGSQIDLCVISPTGVTYERAVLEEETLPVSNGDVASDKLLRQRNSAEAEEGLILDGVCGFGSLPYAIKTRRVLLQDGEQEIKRRILIEKIMG